MGVLPALAGDIDLSLRVGVLAIDPVLPFSMPCRHEMILSELTCGALLATPTTLGGCDNDPLLECALLLALVRVAMLPLRPSSPLLVDSFFWNADISQFSWRRFW
jgi:hypothetical protein